MTPATLSAIREILGPYFSEARAKAVCRLILEAVREPTEAQVAEGRDASGDCPDDYADIAAGYRAMIDALLSNLSEDGVG